MTGTPAGRAGRDGSAGWPAPWLRRRTRGAPAAQPDPPSHRCPADGTPRCGPRRLSGDRADRSIGLGHKTSGTVPVYLSGRWPDCPRRPAGPHPPVVGLLAAGRGTGLIVVTEFRNRQGSSASASAPGRPRCAGRSIQPDARLGVAVRLQQLLQVGVREPVLAGAVGHLIRAPDPVLGGTLPKNAAAPIKECLSTPPNMAKPIRRKRCVWVCLRRLSGTAWKSRIVRDRADPD